MYPSWPQTERRLVVPNIEMLPRVGWRQAGQSSEQSGLPCPVVAENGVETPGSELRAHTTQGGEASKLLDQTGDDDGGRHRNRR